MTSLAPAFRSSKAAYRPGKQPRASSSSSSTSPKSHSLKRTSSAISLPSPPDELAQGPLAPSYLSVEDEEVDELDEEDASSGANPFVVPGDDEPAVKEQELAGRPDHPLTSPTHRVKRRRVSADRVQLGSAPRKAVVQRKVPEAMGKGWEDESNPFIARADKSKGKQKERRNEEEPNVTYVFRGKRIHYDLPLSSLLESEDPTESPYANPSPRLLFPSGPDPITPPSAANPSSSFLDALRATAGKSTRVDDGHHLPPTPVTEKQQPRKGASKDGSRFGPYKKMKDVGRQEGEKLRR